MKKWVFLLPAILVLAVVLAAPAYAAPKLDCKYKSTNCPADTPVVVFKMQSGEDSHAGINVTTYAYRICCGIKNGGDLSLMNYSYANRNLCNPTTMGRALSIRTANDSHTARYGQGINYQNNLCLASSSGNVTCQYQAACTAGYTCLASITSVSDAHVGKCDEHPTNICCKYDPNSAPYTPGDLLMGVGETGSFVFNITNPLSEPDIYTIGLYGSPSKLGYWSWFNGHRYDSEKNNMTVTVDPKETATFSVIVFGGEAGTSGVLYLTAKSALTGEITQISKNVDIQYADEGIFTDTPEFGWMWYIAIGIIAAVILL